MDVPGFVAAQLLGAAAATVLFRWLTPARFADAALVGGLESLEPAPVTEEALAIALVWAHDGQST